MYHQADENANIGNIRETFLYNHVNLNYKTNASKVSDFLVMDKYTLEVGGKNKTQKQIETVDHAFVVKDDIQIGYGNVIPLWLFGFLY